MNELCQRVEVKEIGLYLCFWKDNDREKNIKPCPYELESKVNSVL